MKEIPPYLRLVAKDGKRIDSPPERNVEKTFLSKISERVRGGLQKMYKTDPFTPKILFPLMGVGFAAVAGQMYLLRDPDAHRLAKTKARELIEHRVKILEGAGNNIETIGPILKTCHDSLARCMGARVTECAKNADILECFSDVPHLPMSEAPKAVVCGQQLDMCYDGVGPVLQALQKK